jgi:predicted amidohydrolase
MDPLKVLELAGELDIRASAQMLGSWALEHERALVALLRRDEHRRQINAFRTDAVKERPALVASVADVTALVRDYLHAVNQHLVLVVEDQLKPLAVLHAFCLGPLRGWFDDFQGVLDLRLGDPFPYATRDFGPQRPALTPFISTPLAETVLWDTKFGLYGRKPESPLHVVLDYRHRTAIDRYTWSDPDDDTLEHETWGPVAMATVNPYASVHDISWKENDADWFCVKPKHFDKEGVLRQLEAAASHESSPAAIAVLPELSLPHPTTLAQALRDGWEKYPRLVVAGSAHEERDGKQSNVSCTYFQGVEVLRHSKHQRLHLKKSNGDGYPEALSDGTGVLTMLSGSSARLAVVICADLQNDDIVECLETCGANLVLVPSMTPGMGGFKRPVAGSASRNQGVTLVANTVAPRSKNPQHQFLAYLGLPLQDPQRSDESFPVSGKVADWKGWLLIKAWCDDHDDRFTWHPWS